MSTAQFLMRAETSAQEGYVPKTLNNALTENSLYAISKDAFLLDLPSGLRFYYARGKGVLYSRPKSVSDSEVKLFLNGTVYGAIAWLNGLLPLHSSAVTLNDKVHAFVGDTGAGKSTLAAALSARGLPLFADDVLILDMNSSAQIMAIPGHKQLKLWKDAIELTKLSPNEPVRNNIEKYFVDPPMTNQLHPMSIAGLHFLGDKAQATPQLSVVDGVERFNLVRSVFYRPEFCIALTQKKDLFIRISRILHEIPMFRFDRSKNTALFDESTDFMAAALRKQNL